MSALRQLHEYQEMANIDAVVIMTVIEILLIYISSVLITVLALIAYIGNSDMRRDLIKNEECQQQ